MDNFEDLFQKIEHLCARCERLHKEKLQLHDQNKRLLEKNMAAKKRLELLLKNLENLSE